MDKMEQHLPAEVRGRASSQLSALCYYKHVSLCGVQSHASHPAEGFVGEFTVYDGPGDGAEGPGAPEHEKAGLNGRRGSSIRV